MTCLLSSGLLHGSLLGFLGGSSSFLSLGCFGLPCVLGGTLCLCGCLCLTLSLLSCLALSCSSCLGGLLLSLASSNGLASCTELVGEALDASAGVDQLLGAGEEGMACTSDVNLQLGLGGAGNKGVAAGAANRALHVIRMDSVLHGFSFSCLGFRPKRD